MKPIRQTSIYVVAMFDAKTTYSTAIKWDPSKCAAAQTNALFRHNFDFDAMVCKHPSTPRYAAYVATMMILFLRIKQLQGLPRLLLAAVS